MRSDVIQGIADGRICNLPGTVIAGCPGFAISADLEGEDIIVRHITAIDGLGALEGNFAFRFIGVDEVERLIIAARFDLQRAVAVVGNLDRDSVFIGGSCDPVSAGAGFLHGIGVRSDVIQGIGDGRICDLSRAVIADCPGRAVSADLEGEDIIARQITAIDGLGAIEGNFAFRLIAVDEGTDAENAVILRQFFAVFIENCKPYAAMTVFRKLHSDQDGGI